MRSKKKTDKKYIWIAVISFVLVLAIVAVVFYKNSLVKNNETPSEVSSSKLPQVDENIEEEKKPADKKEPAKKDDEEKPVEKISYEAKYIDGQKAPNDPTYINDIMIVNKQFPLPSAYNQGEDKEAKKQLDEMLQAAEVAGYNVTAFSGFRSYEYQTTLYNRYAERDGEAEADRYSARPGYSEHQTGLAFDLGEVGREDLWLTDEFGETNAGKWLMKNAHKYGFILRYPKGKEPITGFMYESWHYRYVGQEHAKAIFTQKITLEEYVGLVE